MANNVPRSQTEIDDAEARDTKAAAGLRAASKNRALKSPKTSGETTDAKSKKQKSRKKTASTPDHSMSLEDLIPGPLPGETQAPQQSAVPRKIKL